MKSIEKFTNKFGPKSFFFTISAFLVVLLIIIFGYIKLDSNSYYEGLRVEAGGFVLDIILFGFVLGFYDYIKSKKQKIDKYKEEIDDYRGWDEKEAGFRVFGTIKRLIKLGELNLDISFCYFEDIRFFKNIFETFNFYTFSLTGAIFKNCKLNSCDFSNIPNNGKTENAKEYYAIRPAYIEFINCDMTGSLFSGNVYNLFKFDNCTLIGSDFNNSKFDNSMFININFKSIKLENTVFSKDCYFENCEGFNILTILD